MLIWLLSALLGQQFRENRGGDTGTDVIVSATDTTDPDDDKNLVRPGDDDQNNDPTTSNGGTNNTGNSDPTNGNDSNGGNNDPTNGNDSNGGNNASGENGTGNQNGTGSEGNNDDNNGNSGDENGSTGGNNGGSDDGSNEGDDSGKPSGGQNGQEDDDSDNDDAASDYAGVTEVRISDVNDATGIITLTIDGKNVVVPVQTTVFNGRVTKSGVAQGKLSGYNVGVTVMLYYPQEDGFSTNSVEGYMNRTEDSLTVVVDVNGDGSKLLIKINGMKALL